MVQTFQVSSLWEPGMPSIWTDDDPHFSVGGTGRSGKTTPVPTPGTAGFVTDLEVEYLSPLYPGDRVSQISQTLLNVNPRRTSVGDGAFLSYESIFQNQRNESVARQIMISYSYIPNPPSPDNTPASPTSENEKSSRAIPIRSNQNVDWNEQRYWEDVNEGDVLPEIQYPLTVQRLVMAAGANRDFNPIHHNSIAAQRGGAPDMYAMNFFHNGMWERAAREFIGLDGSIQQIGPFRMRIFSTVGDTVVVRGKVTRKFTEANNYLLELELESLLASNESISVGPGPVIVTLPSRSNQ